MSLAIDIIALIVLIILSGFFSGAEVALISLSRIKAKQMLANKRLGAHYIQKLKSDPQRMLSTILIGNNVVNITASAITTALMITLVGSHAVGIAVGIMTLLILIFGEITPKTYASSHNEVFAQLAAPLLWWLSIIIYPLIKLINLLISIMFRLFGIKTKEKPITEEEIRGMVAAAGEEGSIKELEKELINKIFEFDDISVGEIITPRADMVMLDASAKVKDALPIMRQGYSRIPIHDKEKDNIVGILYVKDLLSQAVKPSTSIKKVMREPYIVPEAKKLNSLLKQFQKRKEHMAIVVDEHGLVIGLVTLEDVVEEIVGDIKDETDSEETDIKKVGPKKWVIRGNADIDEAAKQLGIVVKGDDFDTFSGFILNSLGRLPKKGEEIAIQEFQFKILERDRNRIILISAVKKR